MKKKLFLTGSILLLIFLIACSIFLFLPSYEDRKRNTVAGQLSVNNQQIRALHQKLFVADLHADSLLWNRNLMAKNNYGHVDIPRLRTGNVALQVFSVVTKTPRGLNLQSNSSSSDNITLLAIIQRWPVNTWKSIMQRAVYQAEKLHSAAINSNNRLAIIKTRKDLQDLIHARKADNEIVGALLSLEGAHALEGQLNNVDKLFALGYRIIGFTHFFDNELGGSAHGIEKSGITPFGLAVLTKMEKLGILVDIAHASPALIDDIFRHASRPVIASHTGVKGICNSGTRNLSDKHIQKIAESGGVIGIGFWPVATCSDDVKGIIDSIRYVTNLVGVDYVALGSDFDGNVQTPFDAENVIVITEALVAAGFTNTQIQKIMGENVLNLLLSTLPY